MRSPAKQYFSERQGRGPKAEPMPFPIFLGLVIDLFDRFREQGHMQEAFGHDCVDGTEYGTLGPNPNAYFTRTIMRQNVWPYWRPFELEPDGWAVPYEFWDADYLFDVVEVLHDLISKPTDGEYHSHADCGMHYSQFNPEAGRLEFREEMNEVLRLYDPPYEMNDDGLVVEATPAAFHPLLSADVPRDTDAEITSKIESAVARFRARGTSPHDRRTAVRDLADILEALRSDMQDKMLPKDERELFHIANGFSIRHQNREQRADYDKDTWLRWAFYVYLATIHAVLRVRDRVEELPPTPTS